MAGNGRWAQKRHCRVAGTPGGDANRLRTTIETCARLKGEALTRTRFGGELAAGRRRRIEFLMQLLREIAERDADDSDEQQSGMRFLGRPDDCPMGAEGYAGSDEATAGNTGRCFRLR